MRRRPGRRGDERGAISPLIIGFTLVLLMVIAVVVDASAAFLKRQDLATVAEGAALQAADLGAEGEEVYRGGLGDEPLRLTESSARAAVHDYLAQVGRSGVSVSVSVRGDRVVVSLTDTAELPLGLPGLSRQVEVTGTGSAIADPEG